MTRVYVACTARNVGAWIDAFVESLVAQSHTDWELWVRDDASTDDTAARLAEWHAREPRVAMIVRGERSIGAAQGFADVLRRLPADAEVVATGDADDVWLSHRLKVSLAALEGAGGIPTLVHSDLRVVDEDLRELAPSFWQSEGINPAAAVLPELAIQNVAVGPTLTLNAALLSRVKEIPAAAPWQDWWIALVAAVTGQIIAVAEPTVLYRQHGANAVGARLDSAWSRLAGAFSRRQKLRSDLDKTSRQAHALVARYGSQLSPGVHEALEGLGSIGDLRGWRRKVAIVRWRWLPAHGLARNLGMVLRG